ncbi:MAG: hypothetical protein QMB51_02240 [Patescibacteria group bacterium]
MRKFFIFIVSAAFIFSSLYFVSCNKKDEIGILNEIKRLSNISTPNSTFNNAGTRTKDQEMMLGTLFYEVESDARNIWDNSLFYYQHLAKIDDQIITFSNGECGPNLYGTIQGNDFQTAKFRQAIYISNGFTGCSIGKTTNNEIYSRFGEPDEIETRTKFVYYEGKKSITFFFKDNILKNIMLSL